MNQLPLTIVTAVLNEEENLASFLDYAQGIAQEVIVVIDFRSKDKSLEIAQSSGCKVITDDGSSKGIVFNNKNLGAKAAAHNWVLILDTDEKLDKILEEEIRAVALGQNQTKATLFQTGFINYEFGKPFVKCDQKHKKFIRFFKKGSFQYNTNNTAEGLGIHTSSLSKNTNSFLLHIPIIRTWVINKNPDVATFKGYLLHNSHPTVSDFLRKIDLYSTREATILYKMKSPSALILKMITAPLKEFLYKYFIWKFYREGVYGFVVSVLYAVYHFLIYSKAYILQCKDIQSS